MPAIGDIYLGAVGTEALLPAKGRKYLETITEISKVERAASGMLRKDITATKREFTLTYESIETADLSAIITLYELQSTLSLKVYTSSATVPETYTVLMEPFEKERVLIAAGGLWTGVTVKLLQV
jgi:predicted glycosyl hydrolase (DUF1957 family)